MLQFRSGACGKNSVKRMADTGDCFDSALEKAQEYLTQLGMSRNLRPEQKQAIFTLASGKDLLAVLPTGFGKSLIFQLLVRVREIQTGGSSTAVVVVCPLKSIVQDQISEARSMGLRAVALTDVHLEDIENGKYQLVFASAEEILSKKFLASLKKADAPLHQQLCAIIVDESHTVETWTGERSSKKGTSAFRESFGKLGELRSFCKPGTPVGALTGTADPSTKETIKKVLNLKKDTAIIYVSPNRANLRFSVKCLKKEVQLRHLDWLVHYIEEEGVNCPKTIVFCNTINDIALVVNYLMFKLGKKVYFPAYSTEQDNCLIGVYHSNSWQSAKDRVMEQFKVEGVKRVIIATTALCMGVNFPDVRFVINWGPARTILDQHQEAGRAGRDGKQSHIIVLYHGQQAGPCEKKVKDFVRAEKGCFRVAAYRTLDATIQPLEPLHDCCSFCSTQCKCAGDSCDSAVLPFEALVVEDNAFTFENRREVTQEDRETLKEALCEVLQDMKDQGLAMDESSSHGFSMQLIEDVCKKCETVFTIQDLLARFPVYSSSNALRVLEVIQEVFMDIPNFEESLALFNLHVPTAQSDVNKWFDFENIELGIDVYDDTDLPEL